MSTVTKLRLRAYNVGFGDCFLLTFTYAGETPAERHVLIDCGSTALPGKSGPPSIKAVAEKIKEHSGGKLSMVAVTHRHTDHMSGFAGSSGAILKALDPDLIVQPWTEDPKIAPDATAPPPSPSALQADKRLGVAVSLQGMYAAAAQISQDASRLRTSSGVSTALADRIAFLGDTNIANADAVNTLISMPGKHVYAHFGTALPIDAILPGVRIDVLGPPTLKDWPQIAQLASEDATEYWHLAARSGGRLRSGKSTPLFPRARKSSIPQGARWLVPKIERMNADELFSIVRSIDDSLNNTSLILLFEVAGLRLLFPGDAQIENWRYALFGPDAARVAAELAATNVYKVGHHGSLNATPKTMWNAFLNKMDGPRPGRLRTVMSTKAGKHGTTANESEVPRRKLVDALKANSDLIATNTLRSKVRFWTDVEIDLPVV